VKGEEREREGKRKVEGRVGGGLAPKAQGE